MFVSEAPFLSALQGARLRTLAVSLQNYADVNTGAKSAVHDFWAAQVALAENDSGLPSDGTYVPGVKDLRMTCYKVLSHYRSFNPTGVAEYIAFCNYFITKNSSPLEITTNLALSKAVAAGSTLALAVAASGGVAPYTYAWSKDNVVIEDRVSASFTKSNAAAGDAGAYQCTVTDSAGTSVASNVCAVTVTE